jgi:hypothetical protein
MEKDFETQVLTRLAVIESKIDDYKNIKDKANEAYTLSRENKEDINEINDKIKWITRLVAGAIITGVIGLIFALIQK